MMDFVCGMDEDKFIETFHLGLGFQLGKQHSLFWYDFVEVIFWEMLTKSRNTCSISSSFIPSLLICFYTRTLTFLVNGLGYLFFMRREPESQFLCGLPSFLQHMIIMHSHRFY